MGTNFYARIIPTKERKKELCNLIESSNDFRKIKEVIQETYGNAFIEDGTLKGGVIHLGKRSAGWKFLWNPNCYVIHNGHIEWVDNGNGFKSGHYIPEPSTLYKLYNLTKKGIKDFIDRDYIEVYDEYGEKQDKEEFFKEAIEWTTWNDREAWDSKTYAEYERKNNPNWKIYKCSGELVELLISEGYKMISEDYSDFYSDELRFSTSNEFS